MLTESTVQKVSPLALALLGLLLLLVPYAILRQHSYFLIDDSLDSDVSVYYLLNRYDVAFDYRASSVIPSVMNGLPRNAVRPGLSVTTASFALFQPWAAYLIHQGLVRIAGLLGMYALLCGPMRLGRRRYLAAALALGWASLPTYTIFGITVLGQPALLWAFLELRCGKTHWGIWATIALFACWSTFVFVGPFALIGLGALLLWDWWQTRRFNGRVAAGIGLLLGAYLVAEWPLFYSLLTRQFVPYRLEFDLSRLAPLDLKKGLQGTVQHLLFGQYHASRFLRIAAPLAVAVAIVYAPAGQRLQVVRRYMPWALALILVALVGSFYPQVVGWAQVHWPALGVFNSGRFYFLAPLLYFLLLALAVGEIPTRWQAAVVGLQLVVGLAMNGEWANNLRALAGQARPHDPSYSAYVAPALFAQVQAFIRNQTGLAPAEYRIACLGLAPGVAQLNDFYTLDSYQNYYPLPYKHRFRPLIAGELAKSAPLETYFDAWGSRCYLFSAELGRNFQVGAVDQRVVQDFDFDAAAFQRLGGRYVVSAARLATPSRSGLRLVQVFERPDAYWRIWLYEVKS